MLTVFIVTFQVTTLHLTQMSNSHISIVLIVVASFASCSLPIVVVLVKRGNFAAVVIASLIVVVVIVPIAMSSLIVH